MSGGLAGTISSTLTSPLEVVKTQLQSSAGSSKSPLGIAKGILEQDGITGFWRGLPPTLVGIIPARSIYFYSYQTSKEYLESKDIKGTANSLLAGLAAGIAANSATNPIWMVKTRMQLTASSPASAGYSGYGPAIRTIYREEGLKGFYRGVTASYWGASEGMVQFVVYEKIKTALLQKQSDARKEAKLPEIGTLPKSQYFLAAGFSKAIATVSTYPHEVARTRMRELSVNGVYKYSGMIGTLSVIAKEEGRRGLYGGMGTHVARVVPNSAVMFLVYETARQWIGAREARRNEREGGKGGKK